MKKHIANIITGSRMAFSLPLVFIPLSSVWFAILYLYCGLTDMIDGTIARKADAVSKFGAGLDTLADSVFVAVCFVKILPLMRFPSWLRTWIVMIAIIKIGNVVWGSVSHKKPVSAQTVLSKISGFLLFLLPLTFGFIEPIYSCAIVCLAATLAAIHEVYHTRKGKE